jgi:predicted metal-dependent peptidase
LPDFVLPGTRRPVPNVAVVVDTSGSIDDTLLSRALGEVDGALRGLGVSDASVTVFACDAAVQTVARIRNVRDSNLAGGGGTDMRTGIAAASDLRPRPDLIVVFTDGYTPWPEQPPTGSAVIAGILGRKEHTLPPSPAWARRIECRL